MFRKAISSLITIAALTLGATQAHAIKIKDLSIKENTGKHYIHVKFDRSKHNWTKATSKPVSFKLQWQLNVRSSSVIKSYPHSKVIVSVVGADGISGTYKLKENRLKARRSIRYKVSDIRTFSFPGSKLALASDAVAACKNYYAQGGRPDKNHSIYVGTAISKIYAEVLNYGGVFQIDDVTKSTTSKVFAVCQKDPKWHPAKILDFHVENLGGTSCPKSYKLRASFISDNSKPLKIHVRADGVLEDLKTVSLTNQGAGFTGSFTKTYKLDPGKHTFKIAIKDGPKSSVKTVTVTCPPMKVTLATLRYYVENNSYCPKEVEEIATFQTTRPGKFPYKIMHKELGIVAWQGTANSIRKGDYYFAEVRRKFPVTLAGTSHLKAKGAMPGDASSNWTKLKVDCLKMMSSTLTVSDPKNNGKDQCPRQGAVNGVMIFNKPGEAKYMIKCNNGFSKTAKVMAKKNILAGDYRAAVYHYFDIKKSGLKICALHDVYDGNKVVATAHKLFGCIGKNVDGGMDDLAPKPVDDPTYPFPTRKLKGDFTFLDNTGTKCSREGKALISFVTPKPAPQGDVHWKLNCTNGKVMTGVAKSVKVGPNKYVATAMARFNIKKTSTYSCGLNSSAPGPVKGHAYKSHKFHCVKRVGPTGPGQVAQPNPPSSSRQPATWQPPKPVSDYKAPKCKSIWKTKCTRKPVKKCHKVNGISCKPVVKKQCKVVTGRKCKPVSKRICTTKTTKSCKRKQVRVCKNIRGKLSCETVWKTECKPIVKRTCKTKVTKQCQPTLKRVCTNKVTKKCQRKTAIKCKTDWIKSCKREKKVVCSR